MTVKSSRSSQNPTESPLRLMKCFVKTKAQIKGQNKRQETHTSLTHSIILTERKNKVKMKDKCQNKERARIRKMHVEKKKIKEMNEENK